VLKEWPELKEARRLTLAESMRSLNLALWDEDAQRLVPFRQLAA
jgi:hypothetical protein